MSPSRCSPLRSQSMAWSSDHRQCPPQAERCLPQAGVRLQTCQNLTVLSIIEFKHYQLYTVFCGPLDDIFAKAKHPTFRIDRLT